MTRQLRVIVEVEHSDFDCDGKKTWTKHSAIINTVSLKQGKESDGLIERVTARP